MGVALIFGLTYYFEQYIQWAFALSVFILLASLIYSRLFKVDAHIASEIISNQTDTDRTLLIIQGALFTIVLTGQVLRFYNIRHELVIVFIQQVFAGIMLLVFYNLRSKRMQADKKS